MQNEQNKACPRVTIMIPTYGQEDVILEALDSALAQNYPNLEIVVADDASPDRTAQLVSSRQDSRLRYYRNPVNLGRVANYRNTLYNLASGDWVVNLDGDDYYNNPDFISEAMQVARSDSDILVVSANCQIVREGHYLPLVARPRLQVMSGVDVVGRVYDRQYHLYHMSTIYHRPTALSLDFYRANVTSSDWESLYRLALCGKVAFINTVAGEWRLSGKNASSTYNWQSSPANLAIWDTIFSIALEKRSRCLRLFISKQRILFSMVRQQLSLLSESNLETVCVFKYFLLVRHYAGNLSIILLLFQGKALFKLFHKLMHDKYS